MRFYKDALSHFYRSMHLIAGHVIAFDDSDHAHGVVHCRAEHEAGTQWGIMVVNCNRDDYERHGNTWYFRRRRLQPLYTTQHPVSAEGARFPPRLGGGRRRQF